MFVVGYQQRIVLRDFMWGRRHNEPISLTLSICLLLSLSISLSLCLLPLTFLFQVPCPRADYKVSWRHFSRSLLCINPPSSIPAGLPLTLSPSSILFLISILLSRYSSQSSVRTWPTDLQAISVVFEYCVSIRDFFSATLFWNWNETTLRATQRLKKDSWVIHQQHSKASLENWIAYYTCIIWLMWTIPLVLLTPPFSVATSHKPK